MAYYRQVGEVPPKRHTQFRRPDGGLYSEELMGEEGFSSDSSLLYHRGIPSALVDARPWELPDQSLTPNAPLVPRHLKLHDLFPGEEHKATDPVTGRRLVLGNADVRISYAVSSLTEPVLPQRHRRRVRLRRARQRRPWRRCSARWRSAQGDYVILPRATTHRWMPDRRRAAAHLRDRGQQPHRPAQAVPVEVRPAARARAVLRARPARARPSRCWSRAPTSRSTSSTAATGPGGLAGTVHVTPEHPFDVVGWDGCLYPYAFNVADFEPITGRVHQPPPVHQVFEGSNFVICNFVPRKVDYHPLAVPVPYYHSNVDSDEVMFYVDGDYEARKGSGIGKGSISLHPGGHSHGPQPGAVERSLGAEYFDELAVMVDTFRPLVARRGRHGRRTTGSTPGPGRAGGRRHDADGAVRRAVRRRRAVPARRCRRWRRRCPRTGSCGSGWAGWSGRSSSRPAGSTSSPSTWATGR